MCCSGNAISPSSASLPPRRLSPPSPRPPPPPPPLSYIQLTMPCRPKTRKTSAKHSSLAQQPLLDLLLRGRCALCLRRLSKRWTHTEQPYFMNQPPELHQPNNNNNNNNTACASSLLLTPLPHTTALMENVLPTPPQPVMKIDRLAHRSSITTACSRDRAVRRLPELKQPPQPSKHARFRPGPVRPWCGCRPARHPPSGSRPRARLRRPCLPDTIGRHLLQSNDLGEWRVHPGAAASPQRHR